MKVRDILTAKGDKVAITAADATIEAALQQLKSEGVGALVVCQDGKSVTGILSERDVVRALADRGAAVLSKPVIEIMTKNVQTTTLDTAVQEIMSIMTQGRFRHMPVVQDGKLCGIVSIGDVVKNRLDELETETHVLRDYIGGRI